MASKKTSATQSSAQPPAQAPASKSKLPAGKGSKRKQTRLITISGGFKTFKTTSLAELAKTGRTKIVASDANALPTLQSLKALPADEDIHEFDSLKDFRDWCETALEIAETEGPEALGIDTLLYDSATQDSDNFQRTVARQTGQKFLGDDPKSNGWMAFNAQFGAILDLLAALSRYINVVVIVHDKPKFDANKGAFASFSLSPAMAEKLGRLSNWILHKTVSEVIDEGDKRTILEEKRDSPWYIIAVDPEDPENADKTRIYETVFHTKPHDGYIAAAGKGELANEEPGTDLKLLMEKAGLKV